jgi:uncharacterized protein YndB with AHSA1/START domain
LPKEGSNVAVYRAEIDIAAPPELVFAYLSDLTRHPEWSANRLKIERAAGDGAGPPKFRSAGHQFGQDTVDEVVITESLPNSRFAYEAQGVEGRFRHVFELAAATGGTRVSKSFEMLKAGGPTRIARILFPIAVPRGLKGDLRRIKARLEQR